MSKYLVTVATLAMLAAPAIAGQNHDYIDSCFANKYECDYPATYNDKYKRTAPLHVEKQSREEREERRLQEKNDSSDVGGTYNR